MKITACRFMGNGSSSLTELFDLLMGVPKINVYQKPMSLFAYQLSLRTCFKMTNC